MRIIKYTIINKQSREEVWGAVRNYLKITMNIDIWDGYGYNYLIEST